MIGTNYRDTVMLISVNNEIVSNNNNKEEITVFSKTDSVFIS